MKRLKKKEEFCGHLLPYVSAEDCFDVWSVPEKFMGNAIDRLSELEDILGDDYDLIRLREIVEADRDGRRNHFTTEWKSTDCFGWTLESPYTN